MPDLSLYHDELAILTKSVIGENKLQRLVASSRCQRVYAIYITFERLNSKGSEKYAAEGFTGGNLTGIRHVHVAVIRSLSFSARRISARMEHEASILGANFKRGTIIGIIGQFGE